MAPSRSCCCYYHRYPNYRSSFLAIVLTMLMMMMTLTVATHKGLRCFASNDEEQITDGTTYGAFHTTLVKYDCAACQKISIVQNNPGLYYTYEYWQCLSEAAAGTHAEWCQPSISITAYPDGSMFRKECACCKDLCNTDHFCTESDPMVQKVVANFSATAWVKMFKKMNLTGGNPNLYCNTAAATVVTSNINYICFLIIISSLFCYYTLLIRNH